MSVKAMNDTAGPPGLVPTLLVFGCMPRIPITPLDLPSQIQRMKAIASARREMSQIMAKQRIAKALRMNVPASAHEDVSIGSQFYREKPESKWVGPYLVLDMKDKSVFTDEKGSLVQVSIDKVKSYKRPSVSTSTTPEQTTKEKNLSRIYPETEDDNSKRVTIWKTCNRLFLE